MGQWIGDSPFATAFYHADGNGNVTCLIYANGSLAAKYLYDPFGNTLAQYGSLAVVNNYRFSSKEWNANSGLYYYLYRFYDPNLQRWVNRDPIQEWSGINLFNFVANQPLNLVDFRGLQGAIEPFDPIEIDPNEPTPDPYGYGPGGQVPRPMPTRNPSGFNGLGDINNEWNHLEPPELPEYNNCPQLNPGPPPPQPPRHPSPPLPPERGCSTCSVNTIPFQVTAPPKPAPPINLMPITAY